MISLFPSRVTDTAAHYAVDEVDPLNEVAVRSDGFYMPEGSWLARKPGRNPGLTVFLLNHECSRMMRGTQREVHFGVLEVER